MMKFKENKKRIYIAIMVLIMLLSIGLLIFYYLYFKKEISKLYEKQEQMNNKLEIEYRKMQVSSDKNKISILVTVVGDNGIKKIIKPDGEEINSIEYKNQIALDYTVDSGVDYKFKAIDENGKETEKIINIVVGEIYTIEDLEEINANLSLSYKLKNNLDFKDRNSYRTQERYEYYTKDEDGDGNPDNSWNPIENFEGILDGEIHKISNLYISNVGNSGLFGSISNAEIRNIVLEDVKVVNATYGGGVAGMASNSSISKVGVSGIIKGQILGGILGKVENTINIEQSYSKINVIGTKGGNYQSVGGIIGTNLSGTSVSSNINLKLNDCYSSGSVTGRLGSGIEGRTNNKSCEGKNSYSICKVSGTYSGPLSNSYGDSYSMNFSNCFWSEETSGQSSGKGIKVTNSQLQTQSTYTSAGWDFNTIWEMDPVTGYPRLQWENNIK